MSERMWDKASVARELGSPQSKIADFARDWLAMDTQIDALRAELAEARLAAAVADGTATREMLRDAGLLEGWVWDDTDFVWQYQWDAAVWKQGWWVLHLCGEEVGTLANLRAADAAVRKLLAEGEAAE